MMAQTTKLVTTLVQPPIWLREIVAGVTLAVTLTLTVTVTVTTELLTVF